VELSLCSFLFTKAENGDKKKAGWVNQGRPDTCF